MSKQVITLGNGQAVGLSAYARGWLACKAAPPGTEFKTGLCNWWPETREKILADFMAGLHDRINIRGEIKTRSRKTDQDYQIRLQRDAQRLRDIRQRRLRVYQFETTEARSRFGHLLARYDD